MKIFLTLVLMLCGTAAFAQTKKFRWTTDLCEFESVYDSSKYSEVQLRDTLKLIHSDFFPNTVDPTPREFAGVKNLSVNALDKEYQSRTTALKQLKIVNSKYWEAVRQKYLKELEQVYQLSRATMLGYPDPSKLKEVKFAEACALKYANPLIEGGDELLETWRRNNEEHRKRNGNPERLRKIFEEQLASPDKFKYAQIEVMTFGWWNCANAFIDREDKSDVNEREFKKLFKTTRTVNCDEP